MVVLRSLVFFTVVGVESIRLDEDGDEDARKFEMLSLTISGWCGVDGACGSTSISRKEVVKRIMTRREISNGGGRDVFVYCFVHCGQREDFPVAR